MPARSRLVLLVAPLALVAMGACGGDDSADDTTTTPVATTAAPATSTAAAATTVAATTSGAPRTGYEYSEDPATSVAVTVAPTAPPSTRPEPEFDVQFADSGVGSILADGEGWTLYVLTADTEEASACDDTCVKTWPPFVAIEDLDLGDGLGADDFGTFEREDGTIQLTYGGNQLYHYAGDSKPGDTNGEGVGDVWFVVKAA